MLSKINRLKNTKDIKRVFKEGKDLREGFLFLKAAKNGLGVTRFTIVVSQKINKKAAKRNEIKRRLREIIRTLLPRVAVGFDVVIVPQKNIENKKFQEIQENTEGLLKKAKII